MANQIEAQFTKTLSLITSALNIHLTIDQNMIMNLSSVFMSLERISFQSLTNKLINQIENAHIYIPSNFHSNLTDNKPVSLRVCFFFLFFYIFVKHDLKEKY